MINRYPHKTPCILVAGVVSLLLAATSFAEVAPTADSTSSDSQIVITACARTWLEENDTGNYQQCWNSTAANFREHVSAEDLIRAAEKAEATFGKCTQRRDVSLTFRTDPDYAGAIKGRFARVIFQSTFAKVGAVKESVSYYKEADGTWRVIGHRVQF